MLLRRASRRDMGLLSLLAPLVLLLRKEDLSGSSSPSARLAREKRETGTLARGAGSMSETGEVTSEADGVC